VVEGDVRDLVHGAIFTRGLKDLKHTAVFIGGADMAAGERLLAAARAAFFGPFTVSVMLDSNGSNTTAVAAVAKVIQTVGDVTGARAVVTAGTGPVGQRVAGLLDACALGGLVLFNGTYASTPQTLARLQQRSRYPLLISSFTTWVSEKYARTYHPDWVETPSEATEPRPEAAPPPAPRPGTPVPSGQTAP